MGLALDMALKFYTSVAKRFKLKVRKFQGIIPALVEVTGKKTCRGAFPPHVNRVKLSGYDYISIKVSNYLVL